MKEFTYIIKDEVGMHARPCGILVKEAAKYDCEIKISLRGKSAEATKLFALMSLGAKCGDELKITLSGDNEEQAFEGMREFFEKNL